MGKHFGIIAEGITDVWTIQQIIEAVYNDRNDSEEATTTELQPMSSEDPGSYTLVFKFLQSEKLSQFLEDPTAHVIIQIDTDTLGLWSEYFKGQQHLLDMLITIPRPDGGSQKDTSEIVNQIIKFMIEVIGKEYYESKKDRIVFAIAVNEIECWILTLHAKKNSDKDKIANCLKSLTHNYGFSIDPNKKAHKNGFHFKQAIKDFKQWKKLEEIYKSNKSLEIFIECLLSL